MADRSQNGNWVDLSKFHEPTEKLGYTEYFTIEHRDITNQFGGGIWRLTQMRAWND